jgi:hypothetical protein
MKLLGLWIFLSALVVSVAFATASKGDEPIPPGPDLGQTNLLTLACDFVEQSVELADGHLIYCRREQPDVINANKAQIIFKIKTDIAGKQIVKINFMKSLWWPSGAKIIG